MFAEVIRMPDGRSLAVDTVMIRAAFWDNPRLFASLQARSDAGHDVFARWEHGLFAADDGTVHAAAPTLILDIGGERFDLRFSFEGTEATEPLEALMNATHAVLSFEHNYDDGTHQEYTEVSVPLPPDPRDVLVGALRWSRAQPKRQAPTITSPGPERGVSPWLRRVRALVGWRPGR